MHMHSTRCYLNNYIVMLFGQAFAFLFYGNSSENLISVRVLVKSMRAAGAIQVGAESLFTHL